MSTIGHDAAIYFNTGTPTIPVWTEIPCVRDVNLDLTSSEVDDTCRSTDGWRSRIQGLKEWGANFDMVHDNDDAGWELVRAAYFNKTKIEVLILDNDISIDGAEGVQGDIYVSDFSEAQPLDDIITNSVVLLGSGTPVWVETAMGAPAPK